MSKRTGLYIHWPFCARICPYCDFTITKSRDEDVEKWVAAYLSDLRKFRELMGPRELVSIYFGGGTPSLLPPWAVEALIEGTAALFDLPANTEITLEANPTDTERARFEEFRSAGVNRLSLGLQSFDDEQLHFLGRNHDGKEARKAAEMTARVFPLYTFDFIYALPAESMPDWEKRLADVLSLQAPHLSFYQLTIEPGTAFEKAVGRGAWYPASDDRAADLYAMTQEMTAKAGCPGYEVSNHAMLGREARHNALYWENEDWIGIGPGAHGRLAVGGRRHAIAGSTDIRRWLEMPFAQRYETEILNDASVVTEMLAGGLRTIRGVNLSVLDEKKRENIERAGSVLRQDGFLSSQGEDLVIPKQFRLLTDYIIGRLVERL